MKAEPGDKVRLKTTTHSGRRAIVEAQRGKKLRVKLTDTLDVLDVLPTDITNYSLAARKAWARMPDRRVGRPPGSSTTDRLSVTLRIDRELWDRFKRAEASGTIEDRTATINAWIARGLASLAVT